MKQIYTYLFLSLSMCCQISIAQQTGKWGDQGDGTFRNPVSLPHGSDDFDEKQLNLRWMWNHQPRNDRWSVNERPGYLRLHAFPSVDKGGFFKVGNTINQRYMRSDSVVVTVKIDIDNMADGQDAGLVHFNGGKSYASIGLVLQGKNTRRLKYESNGKTVDGGRLKLGQKTIYLRTCVGFDNMANFQYSLDGVNFIALGDHYRLTPANFRGGYDWYLYL